MKRLNVMLPDSSHEDLELIAMHYSSISGTKYSKAAGLRRLLHEMANVLKNTGKLGEWEGKNAEWEE